MTTYALDTSVAGLRGHVPIENCGVSAPCCGIATWIAQARATDWADVESAHAATAARGYGHDYSLHAADRRAQSAMFRRGARRHRAGTYDHGGLDFSEADAELTAWMDSPASFALRFSGSTQDVTAAVCAALESDT